MGADDTVSGYAERYDYRVDILRRLNRVTATLAACRTSDESDLAGKPCHDFGFLLGKPVREPCYQLSAGQPPCRSRSDIARDYYVSE